MEQGVSTKTQGLGGAAATASRREAVLEVRDVEMRFGGTQALAGVSIQFHPGEVHAIVGENGAGKSTLVKILSGFYPSGSFAGEIHLDGRRLWTQSIIEAEASGIFLVPQDLQIVPGLTVAENLFLNREPQRFGVVKRRAMLERTEELLREYRIDCDPSDPMMRLTTAQQQLVVIARAMMRGVRVLALDEPTAALTETETHVLFDHVFKLRSRGISIIYISHRLDEITRVADRITVLRDGCVVEQIEKGDPQQVSRRVVRAMIGRDVELRRRTGATVGPVKLALRGITLDAGEGKGTPRLQDIDLEIRSGEVVGLFGSVGCGADHLVAVALGMSEGRVDGEIRIRDQAVQIRSPAEAMRLGIGYLPGDRQRNAAFPLLSIAQNIDILVLDRLTRLGVVQPVREVRLVDGFYSRFRIKARSFDDPLRTLSGGNQQKVILSRALSADPEIFIFHEPTQGVDIATKEDVYEVIHSLARQGSAILVVTSDLEEVMVISDRVVVMRAGRVVGRWRTEDVTQEQVLAAATGGA
jgi:ABC-type sugar transport system ATPase subunit